MSPEPSSPRSVQISCRALSKTYYDIGRREEVVALRDLSLDIHAGELVTVLGPSGCGKSTLLNILAGFERATSGEARLDGELIQRPGADRGVVFQEYALFPWLTVMGNVLVGLREKKLPRAECDRVARSYIAMAGLRGFEGKYPHELSGGMRQRAAIAAALMARPRLLFADEPTTALDVTVQSEILALLAELGRELGMAILLVTHDLGVVAGLADRIAVLYAGRIVELSAAPRFLAGPGHPYGAGLLAALPRLDDAPGAEFRIISGSPPRPGERFTGCRFEPRCPRAQALCREKDPQLLAEATGLALACHFPLAGERS